MQRPRAAAPNVDKFSATNPAEEASAAPDIHIAVVMLDHVKRQRNCDQRNACTQQPVEHEIANRAPRKQQDREEPANKEECRRDKQVKAKDQPIEKIMAGRIGSDPWARWRKSKLLDETCTGETCKAVWTSAWINKQIYKY